MPASLRKCKMQISWTAPSMSWNKRYFTFAKHIPAQLLFFVWITVSASIIPKKWAVCFTMRRQCLRLPGKLTAGHVQSWELSMVVLHEAWYDCKFLNSLKSVNPRRGRVLWRTSSLASFDLETHRPVNKNKIRNVLVWLGIALKQTNTNC